MNSTTARIRLLAALLMIAGCFSVALVAESATAAPAFKVTLHVSNATPAVGQTVKMGGKVTPAAPGKRVKVQGKAAGTGWVTIKRAVLSKRSTFNTSFKFPRAGKVAIRVVKPASGGNAQGISPVRRLRVGGGASAPVIVTSSLPHAVAGSPYTATIETADNRPGQFAAIGLPEGLAIDAQSGVIAGTPETRGTSLVKFYFRDADGQTTSKSISLTVDEPTGPPEISTTSLPGGSVSYAYTATLETVGNRTGTWSLSAGALPAGLTLNGSTGVISGTPTKAGTVPFTVKFTTAAGGLTDTQALEIVVGTAAQPVIETTSLPSVTVLTPYSATLETVSDKVGTWSISGGALPAGLSLNASTGVISGTPESVGTTTFTVRFVQTDSGLDDTQVLSITVEPNTPPIIASSTLPDAMVGEPYSATLKTVGNRSGTWAVIGGALPAGLKLKSTTGVISGTPTAAGTANFTVRFTGLNGLTDTESFSIPVSPAAAPVIITTSLPNGTFLGAYNATLQTQGNRTGTWSIVAGALPGGLSLNGATGVISGTASGVGTANFTVKFTAIGGLSDTQALSITVTLT